LSDNSGWDKDTPADFLMPLTEYWRDSFNWRDQEAVLNQLPHFRSEIDGTTIHYIHVKGNGLNPVPLIMTHGWPDSFTRFSN
jgi:microsomal epoxide hydrolase